MFWSILEFGLELSPEPFSNQIYFGSVNLQHVVKPDIKKTSFKRRFSNGKDGLNITVNMVPKLPDSWRRQPGLRF